MCYIMLNVFVYGSLGVILKFDKFEVFLKVF